ncbi:MAG: hypothetical protein AAB860_00485 [Patescibacteria group bacterium]
MDKNKFKQLLAKVDELKKSGDFDLSLEEDLSIAVMNLVSLEEHFFFTSQKTGKSDYLDLLQQTREVRKQLLAKMIPVNEGETWCISKHLLATTMRLIEVGTKYQTDGKKQEANTSFTQAYKIYSLFWAVRLKLLNLKDVKKKGLPAGRQAMTIEDLTTQLVDCCKE